MLRLPRGEEPFSNENNLRLVHVFRSLNSWKSTSLPGEGMDAARLGKDAALKPLTQENHFRAAVREGIAEADRGEFIEEEDMDARAEARLRS